MIRQRTPPGRIAVHREIPQELRTVSACSLLDEVDHDCIGEAAFEAVPAFDLAAPALEFEFYKRTQSTEKRVADGSFPAHEELLFARGAEPARARITGLRIGLALVKSLVELNAGTITAHSGGAGTGSTFTVRLPRTGCRVHKASRAPEVFSTGTSTNHYAATSPMGDA